MFRDFNEVICLGMGGSYSEIAKDKLFKSYDLYLYQRSLNSIKECIEYIDEFSNAIAILPVETSYKGIIRETIDNLIMTKNQNIQILAETTVPVVSFFMVFSSFVRRRAAGLRRLRVLWGLVTIFELPLALAPAFLGRLDPRHRAALSSEGSEHAGAEGVRDHPGLSEDPDHFDSEGDQQDGDDHEDHVHGADLLRFSCSLELRPAAFQSPPPELEPAAFFVCHWWRLLYS